MDLNAISYQDAAQLTYRINKYVDEVAKYKGGEWGGYEVRSSESHYRILGGIIELSPLPEERYRVRANDRQG